MKRIGLIGGMSWESTAVYYRLINELVREELGGLHSAEIVMRSVDFAPVAALQAGGDWQAAARLLQQDARALEQAGAECLLICTNTMHKVADQVQAAVDIPVLHIADATARAVRDAGCVAPLLLATRFTMEDGFYRDRLRDRYGILTCVPDRAGRDCVHAVIYDELCRGVVRAAAKEAYLGIVDAALSQGADGVIFGCTEVGLLLAAGDLRVPAFDSTALHAAAAVRFALA